MSSELPYFIKMRGCINCDASKSLKVKTGNDYGFDHEIGVACILHNCFSYGHTLEEPFIDPEEWVRMAVESGDDEFKLSVSNRLKDLDEQYKVWCEAVGIKLETLIEKLDKN